MSKSLASKSFTNPDVLKEPDKTHSASVDLGVATATKLVLHRAGNGQSASNLWWVVIAVKQRMLAL
jgi:hypothetical protein